MSFILKLAKCLEKTSDVILLQGDGNCWFVHYDMNLRQNALS